MGKVGFCWGRLNERMHLVFPVQFLAYSKCLTNVNYIFFYDKIKTSIKSRNLLYNILVRGLSIFNNTENLQCYRNNHQKVSFNHQTVLTIEQVM